MLTLKYIKILSREYTHALLNILSICTYVHIYIQTFKFMHNMYNAYIIMY